MKRFVLNAVVLFLVLMSVVIGINYSIDASGVIKPGPYYEMAKLALSGNTIVTPLNYNERLYQVAIIEEMKNIPETIIIGCSRGMFLGEEITGLKNLYNHCVSGGCIEDYCAILGLYNKKFSQLPRRVIIEASPWIFYKDIPESRWKEQQAYAAPAREFYGMLNNKDLVDKRQGENPYVSIPYFRHNLQILVKNGFSAFGRKQAKISTNQAEAADYPDGSLRYAAHLENASEERLKAVQASKGAVKYQNADKMTEIDQDKVSDFENLLNFLQNKGIEVLIFMQPFSVTQCQYSYDKGLNAIFKDAEEYLHEVGKRKNIKIIGGFDARDFGLSDENFIDFMHLDKKGTKTVWDKAF